MVKGIPHPAGSEGIDVLASAQTIVGVNMTVLARYVHTNLVAEDWRRLADFYQEVFGCVPVLPERDYHGPKLEAGTGVAGACLRGMHLRLPGWGEDGPTLEIFQYSPLEARAKTAVNRPGFGHVAFAVDDVAAAREAVLQVGGSAVGEVVTLQTATGARVTWCYVTDPEGNIIELQSWSNPDGSEHA
jgi:predicted enzyme related to lactoylglutathione lyase